LDALAYTTGRDIYFAAGMYAPASTTGRRLLAHEVAHVVQQGSGKEPSVAMKSAHGVKIGSADDPLEVEAERSADEFVSNAPQADATDQQRQRSQPNSIQTFVQRAPDDNAPKPPLPPGAQSLEVGDWLFTTDQTQLQNELLKVVAERGLERGLDDA